MAYSSEVQSIIIVMGHGSMQADKMLGKELRVLHLVQATGSGLRHWAWLGHIFDLKAYPHNDTLSPTRPSPNSITPFGLMGANYI